MTKPKKKAVQISEGRGRPRLPFKKAMGDRICREVSLGKSLRRILKGKGMPSMATVMNWLQDVPQFATQYAHGRRIGMELHIDGLLDLADTANSENAHAVRLRVDTRKWLASKMLPKIYGDRLGFDLPALSVDEDDTPARKIEAARRVAFVMAEGARLIKEEERRRQKPPLQLAAPIEAEFREVE